MRWTELLKRARLAALLALPALLPACAVRELAFDPARDGKPLPAQETADARERQRACRDYPAYVPDSSTATGRLVPHRTIRVNYHFVNSADGSRNFTPEVGTPYVQQLTREVNRKLAENLRMALPGTEGVPPVLPTRLSLAISPMPAVKWDDGIYYHYDDTLFAYVHKGRHRNNTDRRVIERYAIRPDSVLNIFIMPHHPDSVRSATYRAVGVGIALGKALKISGLFEHPDDPPADFAGLTLHEIGHILGLSHTWKTDDGCSDTPNHPNCFVPGEPPCDSLVSNNVMDYNTWQQAWTPCQLGKVHRNLTRSSSTIRSLVARDWCGPLPGKDLRITGTETWEGEIDLFGHVDVLPGGRLTIRCRASFPEGARLTVHPGAVLVLDGAELLNDCGLPWQGIRILKRGSRRGKVLLGPQWKIVTDAAAQD